MNHTFKTSIAMMIPVLIAALFSSCKQDSSLTVSDPETNALKEGFDVNSRVFPITAKPLGKTYAQWGANWWRWDFAFDCANNPVFDVDGSLQNQNQHEHIFFLAGNSGGVSTRSVTIPAHTAIFFPLINVLNDYPCPDTSFHPAPGQSNEDFLSAPAKALMDQVDALSLTLDGTSLTNPFDFRAASSIFRFTGNADLVNCYDACITGTEQQGLTDGYWIMLKPLPTGEHVLHFTSAASSLGFSLDMTYNITIQ